MNHSLKYALTNVYRQYGFELAKIYDGDDILVFTLKTGYFDNADIVPLSESANPMQALAEFQRIGFACTIRELKTPDQAEEELFKGFFSVNSVLQRLDNDYKKFTSGIAQQYSSSATYAYINAPYIINGRQGLSSPTDEIVSRLDSEKPTLFLIEAAAGFGKTCTAYELVHELVMKNRSLPLFAELSRNRQAVIFRHILLDEIDNKFPSLSSRLVQAEMKNGRIVTILDGFDELLRKNEEGADFQSKEPMLETIGEFLSGRAKIVLTTRRTILFEGDAFHEWVESHSDVFDIIRIKISEPRVSDWLSPDRLDGLSKVGIHIRDIANPVLLSYLRCIDDDEFALALVDSGKLVEKYFDFMLSREVARQDLKISPENQGKILRSIAQDMVEFGYTSETREYIVDHIERTGMVIIDDAIRQYPTNSKPTREEIANKLASHALLDRSSSDPNKISFVNEFAFGNYVGEVILAAKEFLNDDLRFLEPTAVSYQPRSREVKDLIWSSLKDSLEFLAYTDRIDIAIRLHGCIDFPLMNGEAQGLHLERVHVGEAEVDNFVFNECTFSDCKFSPSRIGNVTFLNCKFYNCDVSQEVSKSRVHVLGGSANDESITALVDSNVLDLSPVLPDRHELAKSYVLEKFWPVGRLTISHKHRPIKVIVSNSGELRPEEVYDAITELKREGVLLEPIQPAFVEINFEKINIIRKILGRGDANGQ